MAFNAMTRPSRVHLAVRSARYRSLQPLRDARLRTTARTMDALRLQADETAALLLVDARDVDAM